MPEREVIWGTDMVTIRPGRERIVGSRGRPEHLEKGVSVRGSFSKGESKDPKLCMDSSLLLYL